MAVDTARLIKVSDQKGTPPPESHTTPNLDKPADGQKGSLSIDVDAEILLEFKIHAASHSMKLYTLFEAVWIYYKENHG